MHIHISFKHFPEWFVPKQRTKCYTFHINNNNCIHSFHCSFHSFSTRRIGQKKKFYWKIQQNSDEKWKLCSWNSSYISHPKWQIFTICPFYSFVRFSFCVPNPMLCYTKQFNLKTFFTRFKENGNWQRWKETEHETKNKILKGNI